MNCGSCGEVIPADSMFCPECGARQDNSVAGGFQPNPPQNIHQNLPPFPQQPRTFDPVAGPDQRMQQEHNMNQMGQVPPEMLHGMAQGLQQQQNLPPGVYPNQPLHGGYPPNNQFPPQPQPTNMPPASDLPTIPRGPSIASGALPATSNVSPLSPGGTKIAHNPANSPTDAMVNRLAETERAVKNERRNQWLNMNQSSASNVLANLGAELPAHLRDAQGITPAAEVIAGTMGQSNSDGPNDALLRRMCEVASRRVARKRGVAVETPEAKISDGVLIVNLTYVDDGRVLDTPEDLSSAFEHAIQTEVALKGYDMNVEIVLSCMKDGEVKTIGAEEEEDDEEMFACEVCDGLVKESDPKCPHCGAIFEEEEELPAGGPPSRSGPPGPSRGGGPPGPSRGGGPGGPPKRSGPPGGGSGGPPKRSGPPSGGPGGPPKRSGPPSGSSGGPPKRSGPPGGGPGGPPKRGGPPGPKRSPPK